VIFGRHRPATTLVALAVLTLIALALGATGPTVAPAQATPAPAPAPAAAAHAARSKLAPTAGEQAEDSLIQLHIDAMTPRIVTSTGPGTLSITGSLRNAGTEEVHNVEIRAQRGNRLRSEGDIRTALDGAADDDAVTPGFDQVTDDLAPGQQVPVRLDVPLRGATTNSLALQYSGIYDLLINVNGVPDGGTQARLGGVRTLLPVLGLPAVGDRPAEPGVGQASNQPRPVSMLYPIADQPRRLPTGPGEPVLLGDDQLAAELARGGRLDGLLDALESAAPAGSSLHNAICLAVDPDLLRTVADMSGGYRVRGPNGVETDGRGAPAAAGWLKRLRTDAAGRCVVALPYADADLVALSRAGLDDLTGYATITGARIAGEILGTPVRADTTWPADGLLDERSLSDYAKAGGRTVVLSTDAIAMSGHSGRSTTGGVVRLPTPGNTSTGLLADALVTLAAGGQSDQSTSDTSYGEITGSGTRGLGTLTSSDPVSPANSGAPLSDQDAIGAIAFRALSAASSTTTTPLLVAPPHQWDTTGVDARELLNSINTLITAGRLTPSPLANPNSATTGSSASLVYPLRAGAREVPTTVTARLRDARDVTAQLRSAAVPSPGVGVTPAQVFDPVAEGLLRASSAVWRGHPELSEQATTVITDRIRLMRSLVRVLEPPSPYALGDKSAPLPITLANGLPVAMRVRLVLSDTPGLQISSIAPNPIPPIPPMGRLQLKANAQLTRSGQFSVEARLTTATGAPLGMPSRLLLRSTVYGTITLWLTGTAGLLLVILAVRRITRRLRGSAAPGRRSASTPAAPPAPPATPDIPAAPPTTPATPAATAPRAPGGVTSPTPVTSARAVTPMTSVASPNAASPRGATMGQRNPAGRNPADQAPVNRPAPNRGAPNRVATSRGTPPKVAPARVTTNPIGPARSTANPVGPARSTANPVGPARSTANRGAALGTVNRNTGRRDIPPGSHPAATPAADPPPTSPPVTSVPPRTGRDPETTVPVHPTHR
jgi:hypothetical protein